MAGDLDLLMGKWIVKVRPPGAKEPWTWEYEFYQNKTVTWIDLKSAERGSGGWNSTPKLVNIWWDDSKTLESWNRPLTPTPNLNAAWYNSSYYRGPYKIEKPVCPGFSVSGPFSLTAPAEIFQERLLCWAAASASWLRGTGRGSATVADLEKKYIARGKVDSGGALPEENLFEVFSDIGIALKKMPAVDFTYCFVLEKLKTRGHLVLLSGDGSSSMGHTRVVWGVGDPTNEQFSVFDPLHGHGFETPSFKDLRGNLYVGWAK